MLVARDRDLHLEDAVRDQPGEELEGVAGGLVRRGERCAGKLGLDDVVQFLTTLDRLHLGLVQRAPDHEPHASAVSHQSLDSAHGQKQRGRGEVAGRPVVVLGTPERGHVERRREVAVLGRVAQPPLALVEAGHGWRDFGRRIIAVKQPRHAL